MSTTRKRYLEWKNRSLLPQLPIEIWALIFSYLQIDDLFSVRLVSRLFCSCVNQHTHFWSSVIFDIDQCPIYLVASNMIRHVRSVNIDLFTKSNLYSHCTVYLKNQPLTNSITKRRKRRLLTSQDEEQSKKSFYLRCLSIHFESLCSFDQLQFEYLLKRRIRRLEFSYEFLSQEPSLVFLLKLERLKHLKISFLHNIIQPDVFTMMLINTMHDIILVLFQLKRLKSLTLHNLYLIQDFPANSCSIEHLRSLWFEDCINIHFLLSAVEKQHLRTVILRRSTCDRTILTTFLNQINTLHYLDLASLQSIKSIHQNNDQLHISSKLKTCSLNSTNLSIFSFHPQLSLCSLELIDVNIDQLLVVLNTCQSLQILCLFFTNQQISLSAIIKCLQHSRLLIHLHLQTIDADDDDNRKQSLPSNIFILPMNNSLSCFCYEKLMSE